MFDNFVSALGDRFRQQYPQGSIVSDLVQIHGDQYVVKVSVSLANTVLVSTLAADANLMLAENRALERALTLLGIRDLQQLAHEPVNLTVTPLPDLPIGLTNSVEQPEVAREVSVVNEPVMTTVSSQSNLPAAAVTLVEASAPIIEETSLSPVPVVPAVEPLRIQASSQVGVASGISEQPMNFDAVPSFPEPEITMPIANGQVAVAATPPAIPATLPELPIEAVPEVPVAKSSRSKKSTTTPDPLPTATADNDAPLDETTVPIAEPPLSVTDMIPMINMELKRLGWSKERGREYMVSLYNKRASALLSDDELFGLLQHLQAEQVV
jgi:hypothetical protein